MITATIVSDDQAVRGQFDATPFFARGEDEYLINFMRYLEEDNFGAGSADEVAYALEEEYAQVKHVLSYCAKLANAAQPGQEYPGFEVVINANELMAYLQAERPAVQQALLATES